MSALLFFFDKNYQKNTFFSNEMSSANTNASNNSTAPQNACTDVASFKNAMFNDGVKQTELARCPNSIMLFAQSQYLKQEELKASNKVKDEQLKDCKATIDKSVDTGYILATLSRDQNESLKRKRDREPKVFDAFQLGNIQLGDIVLDHYGGMTSGLNANFIPSKVKVVGIGAHVRRGLKYMVEDDKGDIHQREPKFLSEV